MKIADAISLIELGLPNPEPNKTWADLGCGSGTFTKALVSLLGPGSKVYAVDKERQSIQSDENHLPIQFVKLDFIHHDLPVSRLDGILMANALHYVKDKFTLIEKLKKYLGPDGEMIIVEYDTKQSNQWVPYPIDFQTLRLTFAELKFEYIRKLGERPSLYRSGKMYAAMMKLKA